MFCVLKPLITLLQHPKNPLRILCTLVTKYEKPTEIIMKGVGVRVLPLTRRREEKYLMTVVLLVELGNSLGAFLFFILPAKHKGFYWSKIVTVTNITRYEPVVQPNITEKITDPEKPVKQRGEKTQISQQIPMDNLPVKPQILYYRQMDHPTPNVLFRSFFFKTNSVSLIPKHLTNRKRNQFL